MDNYLLLKFLHVLSAIVLIGTGGGIAFFMFMVSRSNNISAIAITARHVVLADWIFTAPAVITQFVSGVLLMQLLGYSFSSLWFLAVMALFIIIGVCWIPVVFIQYKLRTLAEEAEQSLDPAFGYLMRWWTALGVPAFSAIIIILLLMVFKPLPMVAGA